MSRRYGVHEARVQYTRAVREGLQRCEVRIFHRRETSLALNYPELTGPVQRGDRVLVNTTAMDLRLGSGGFHIVVWGPRMVGELEAGRGHIMKLRYTPWQMRVFAVEEEDSEHHGVLMEADDLRGMPVVCLELHSQLLPTVAGVRARDPALQVAYVMTDGGSLPLHMSEVVDLLDERKWIRHTLTAGHSFGGRWEAVNTYSALLASHCALGADVAVVGIGPGAVGTATRFGHSAVQQMQSINAAESLGGVPIMSPRFSRTDARSRHRGISHHSRTVLEHAAPAGIRVVVAAEASLDAWRDVSRDGAARVHRVVSERGEPGMDLLRREIEPGRRRTLLRYMGRSPREEEDFFLAAAAAGRLAAGLVPRRDG